MAEQKYKLSGCSMGGCLLNENLTWGSVLMSYNASPPDPELVGERWRAIWRDRLEHDPAL